MLKMVYATARDHQRLKEITGVLLRYGLQDILRLLGLAETPEVEPADSLNNHSLPARFRQALEALGPTFVKLGQILATRTDLLDSSWTDELALLHSQAQTLPWEALEAQITEDLGGSPESQFAHFERTPLAAASMAQVYRARLHSGEEVIVKVLRPGLDEIIQADLRLLSYLAESLAQEGSPLSRYRPQNMVRSLAIALNDELDLSHEGHNNDLIAAQFAQQPEIVIPKIYWQWSGKRLLVQQFLPGISPKHPERLQAAGLDGPLLAQRGAKAFMQMVLQHRVYHGDPHPGNLLALADNKVGFIDFGMVGRLSLRRRNQVLGLLYAIASEDPDGLVNTLITWSDSSEIDLADLQLAAQNYLAKQAGGPLQLGKALTDLLVLAREHRQPLPADLVVLFKALITADGVLKLLDPQFDIISTLKPMLQRSMRSRLKSPLGQQYWRKLAIQLVDAGDELPQTLRLIMRRLKGGNLNAAVDIKQLNDLGRSLERSASTLAIALVTAALLLGLAPYMLAANFTLFGIPLFAVLGGLLAAGGIILLLWRLRR